MTKEQEGTPQAKLGLTEGIVIAGIPAAGYWLAYLYERGYSSYFGIPVSYIRVDVGTVIGATLGMLGILGFVYIFVNIIYILFPRNLNKVVCNLLLRLLFVTALTLGFVISIPSRDSQKFFFAMWLVFVFLEIIWPLFAQRKTKGYLSKIEAQQNLDETADTLTNRAASMFPKTFAVAFLLFLLSEAAYWTGSASARLETEFWQPAGDRSLVVVRHYGDVLIAARYYRSTKTLTGEILILPTNENRALRLDLVNVGPLVPYEKQKAQQ
jgi:hypothetical protein